MLHKVKKNAQKNMFLKNYLFFQKFSDIA